MSSMVVTSRIRTTMGRGTVRVRPHPASAVVVCRWLLVRICEVEACDAATTISRIEYFILPHRIHPWLLLRCDDTRDCMLGRRLGSARSRVQQHVLLMEMDHVHYMGYCDASSGHAALQATRRLCGYNGVRWLASGGKYPASPEVLQRQH